MSVATLYLIALRFTLKVKDTNLRYFWRSYVIISQKMTDMVQVTIAIIWEVIYGLSNAKHCIWHWPILKHMVNVMHIQNANIFETVKDNANSTIANKYEII